MPSILETLSPLLQGGALDKLSGWLGESSSGTRKALSAALAASVAGLADSAGTEGGAQQLLDRFHSGDYPRLDPAQAGGPAAAERLQENGGGFIHNVLGAKTPSIVDAIASHSGTRRASASKLLGLAMPMVLGVVARQALGKNLDAGGLSRYLAEQKSLDGDFHGERQPLTRRPSTTSGPGWLALALAALAVILGLGWAFSRARHLPPATPSGRLAAGSPMGDMQRFLARHPIGPRRFTLTDIDFPTGSTQLSAASKPAADELASVLNTHRGVKVRLEGVADAGGDSEANQRLATARADALKQYLVEHGVAGERIETGMGTGRQVGVVVNPRD